MERTVAYCSACDRNVPVVILHGPSERQGTSLHDAEEAVVCLDYGVRCTGALCPMFRVSNDVGAEPPRPETTRSP